MAHEKHSSNPFQKREGSRSTPAGPAERKEAP